MKVLVFGATGSAGGSVVRACVSAPLVDEVRTITRRPLGWSHGKLRAFVHGDYVNYTGVEPAFAGIDACLFCLGVSVTQVSAEDAYRTITHDYALAAAHVMKRLSPSAAFHFVSGRGTSVESRFMWARVKGETERDLTALVQAVCWRPGAIDGLPSASEPRLYAMLRPAFRLLKPFRGLYVEGGDIGRAMLQATAEGMRARVIENAEIRDIADRAAAFRGTP